MLCKPGKSDWNTTCNWNLLRLNELADTPLKTFIGPLREYIIESEPFLCVRETGENGNNPHYHLCFATSCATQTIRTRINRSAWKGNENYSLKVGVVNKLDDQFNYLCKGSSCDDLPQVLFASAHFDDSVIEERHKAYWIKNEEIVSASRKRKANSGLSVGEQIYTICKQKSDTLSAIVSEDTVIEVTMRWYINHKTSMSLHHVTSVVNWVVGKLHTQETLNDLGHDIWDSNRMEIFKQNVKLKLNNY